MTPLERIEKEKQIETLSKETLDTLQRFTTLCVNEEEENIFFQGFWAGYHSNQNVVIQEAIERMEVEKKDIEAASDGFEYTAGYLGGLRKSISILNSLKIPE